MAIQPSPSGPQPQAAPTARAEYNPAVLVHDVANLLALHTGVTIVVDSTNVTTAVIAAADLLRALHVMPVSVPRLP